MTATQPAIDHNTLDYRCDRLDNGIYHVTFHNATHRAVDRHIEELTALYKASSHHDRFRMLMDLRQVGWPPMAYMFQQMTRLNRRYLYHPTCRMAFLHGPDIHIGMGYTYFSLMYPRGKAKFFKGRQFDAAIAWLLANN
ncbi:MAG: STAS/SEC14 domain-containing protein [Chloroflexi bacterium]|nr:MAG: STAS/SEC14 domain-containing protein [Chloroflexota bacterium]